MDYLQFFTPEIIRHLSTALVVKAASRDCAQITCAPSLACAAPAVVDSVGYSGYTVSGALVIGILVGVAAYHSLHSAWHKSPSAATIALRKSAC